jgi:hypothetical protein
MMPNIVRYSFVDPTYVETYVKMHNFDIMLSVYTFLDGLFYQ